jgi:pSer/pThr/pTyr-binding forkhead associated (FHA) protein
MNSWTVGRNQSCDIVVEFPTVSRRHAKLTGSGPEIEIRDIGSSTGTFVMQDGDWSQVTHATVSCDEPIRLGDHKTTARALLATAGVEIEAASGPAYSEVTTQPRRGS